MTTIWHSIDYAITIRRERRPDRPYVVIDTRDDRQYWHKTEAMAIAQAVRLQDEAKV